MIKWKCLKDQRVTSIYGWRKHPTLKKVLFHYGIDISSYSTNKILSPLEGKIIEVGYDDTSGYFYKVEYKLENDNTLIVSYCHLVESKKSLLHRIIKKDEWFAIMGNSGRSSATHLHLTFRLEGEIINPQSLFEF